MADAFVLLAGGRGTRMAGAVDDKVLAPLAGKACLAWSVDAFRASGLDGAFVVVCRDAAQRAALAPLFDGLDATFVEGGAERQDSVLAGLRAARGELVFVHDGARPAVRPETLRGLRDVAARDGSAVLARPVRDTVRELPVSGPLRARARVLDRSRLWAMETPQVARLAALLPAYQAVVAAGLRVTDDAAALEHAGLAVSFVDNPFPNPKLTTPADLPLLEALLRALP